MKKTALILAALVAGASLSAQDAAAQASSYSVTVDFPYASKYVFRGVQLAEGSLQPSIQVDVGSAYVGIWTNQPITSNIDNEFNFYGGYNFTLNDSWSLDLGATVYYYPELDSSLGADRETFEGYVGLNGTFGSFSTGVYAYNDFTLDNFTVQGTFGYSVSLSDKASFDLLGTIGHVSADSGDDYTYYGIGASVPYALSDTATLTAGIEYASHDIDGLEKDHLWFTLGLSVSF
jgi:uncharacterized protein (TIGR02001 family)